MKLLLDTYHGYVDVRNKNEGTPLHVAASQAQPEAAKILIQHGTQVNARQKNGATPLHFAALKGRKPGHVETARMLLEHGADVNAETDSGITPLSMTMSRQNTEMISLLRQHGARAGKQMRQRQGSGMRNSQPKTGMNMGMDD